MKDRYIEFFKNIYIDIKVFIGYFFELVLENTKVKIMLTILIAFLIILIIYSISVHIYRAKGSNDPKERYIRHE